MKTLTCFSNRFGTTAKAKITRCVAYRLAGYHHECREEEGTDREHQSGTGQRSNAIVLGYVAAATVDEDPPLLEIVG